LFLDGLEKYGKGDWRSISRNFVVTRTPTQLAIHGQKYFSHNQQKSAVKNKKRKRSSIHDITLGDSNSAPVPIDQNFVTTLGEGTNF
jgi:SHAQKYF class myb-like DNA-binding protein